MELKEKSFTVQELYKIAKEGPEKTLDGFAIDKLSFVEKNKFYKSFEDFMNAQFVEINTREIQEETIAFIYEAEYEVKDNEIDYDEYDTELKVDILTFDMDELPRRWIKQLQSKTVERNYFSQHRNGEIYFHLSQEQVISILNSDAYNYIKKFNETKRMEKKYPKKESLIKKIISKI